MRALRLATVAVVLSIVAIQSTTAHAQVLDTGEGRCKPCGHSERDTQRYVNSFLNQIFFPRSVPRSLAIAASLYLFNGTYTMHGGRSPDPNFASVTISITAELKGALPSGNYRVVVTTPGGKTSTETYAIGDVPFRVIRLPYTREKQNSGSGAGASGGGRSGPSTGAGTSIRPGNRSPAKCSRSRREDRGNETIVWCSQA